jgi:membrane protein DedA with SNARE-associated domain
MKCATNGTVCKNFVDMLGNEAILPGGGRLCGSGRAFAIPAASLVVAAVTAADWIQFCDARDNPNRGRVLTIDVAGV